jgi:hypothetical protein
VIENIRERGSRTIRKARREKRIEKQAKRMGNSFLAVGRVIH